MMTTSKRVQDILADNPWRAHRHNPFILDADVDRIVRYNETVTEQFQLRVDVPPEPIHGNPLHANVVVLMLNPGFHDDDVVYAADPEYCEQLACEMSMVQGPGDYPFVPLDPRWRQTPTGSWWRKVLSRLIAHAGEQQVAERFAVLEWYPYHSRSFRYKSHLLRLSEATAFNQSVAAACVNDPDKTVICMRGHDLWTMGCKFDAYELPRPVNPRCASLTPGNLGDELFEDILGKMTL